MSKFVGVVVSGRPVTTKDLIEAGLIKKPVPEKPKPIQIEDIIISDCVTDQDIISMHIKELENE